MKDWFDTVERVVGVVGGVVGLVGGILGIWGFALGLRDRRPRVRLAMKRGVLLHGDGRIDEMVALHITNRGLRPFTISSVGCYLNRTRRMFIKIDAIDVKGEPLVGRIEPGDSRTLRIPFNSFRGHAAGKLDSVFMTLPDETKLHVRVGRNLQRLIAAGAQADEETFGDVVKSVTLPANASDDDVNKVKRNLQHEKRRRSAEECDMFAHFPPF